MHTYFQNNSVDNYFYVVFVGVILSLLISSIFLIGYIVVRGFSMEVQESEKPFWKKIASDIYSVTFHVGILQLILIISTFLLLKFVGSLLLAIVFWFVVIIFYSFFDELKLDFFRLKPPILNQLEKINKILVNFRNRAIRFLLIICLFIIIDRSFFYAIVFLFVFIFSLFFTKYNLIGKKKKLWLLPLRLS